VPLSMKSGIERRADEAGTVSPEDVTPAAVN
jgi:hypothetical protein